jgi:hypothetical protein
MEGLADAEVILVALEALAAGPSEEAAPVENGEQHNGQRTMHNGQSMCSTLHVMFMAILTLVSALVIGSYQTPAHALEQKTVLSVLEEGPTQTQSITKGMQRVPVVALTFSASCAGPVTLTGIALEHQGLGNHRDISRLYLLDGISRASRTAPIVSRDGSVFLRLFPIELNACASKKLVVVADISADAEVAGEHGFSIPNAKAIESSAQTVTVLQRRASQSLRTVGGSQGTVTATFVDVLGKVTYGQQRMVARLRLRAQGNDDQVLTAITFTNDGSARATDLRRLFLESTTRTKLSRSVDALDGNRVRLVFDPPLVLRANEERLIALRADVVASRRRTIRFVLDEPSDLEAYARRGR